MPGTLAAADQVGSTPAAEPPAVLLLGDPRLRVACAPIERFDDPALPGEAARLLATLDAFRARHGFGRGIAAPQIGLLRRLVALRLPGWPPVIANPRITWRSRRRVSLWDDCMSFPFLLVRLRRAASISLAYCDLDGRPQRRVRLDTATSELLQHELDHLDGILAIDHADGRDALVARALFEARPADYLAQVDYVATAPADAAAAPTEA